MFNNKFRIGVLQHPGYNKGKGGGGSAPAQPTQSTSYTTNIPEYARPYVENMLNAAQAQIYDPSGTGFNKYVPYSTDPTKYVAGFSPLQSYAQSGAAGLTLPSNYGLATGQTLGTGAQLGILARIDDSEYSPLNIFVARDHHYNIPYFSELKEGDIIMVRVMGQRFELNDPFVSVIAELELKQERESSTSIRREIENAQKKGKPLSVILEEDTNILGESFIPDINEPGQDEANTNVSPVNSENEEENEEEKEEEKEEENVDEKEE